MAEQIGIKEFSEAYRAACKILNPLLDGFQFMKDIGPLTAALVSVPAAIEDAEQIPAELQDYTIEEQQAIDQISDDELTNLTKLGEDALIVKEKLEAVLFNLASVILIIRKKKQ